MSAPELIVTIAVALIGGVATVAGPILLYLLQQTRREARDFRRENSKQHGETLSVIRDIQLDVRETRQDVRELRTDFEGHQHTEAPKKITPAKSQTKATKAAPHGKAAK